MNIYGKSLLSLVTILALNTSATADSYLPLTSIDNDNRWVMFGVNGFKNDGGTPAVSAAFTTPGAGAWTRLDDTLLLPVAGDVATSGLWLVGGDDMGEVKLLSGTGVTSVETQLDLTGAAYSATEPFRSMYLDVDADGVADTKITYKASLDGETLEFEFDSRADSTTYTVSLDSTKTYSTPATGTAKSDTGASGGNDLVTVQEAMDYDMTDNPLLAADYNTTDFQQARGTESSRFYSYDSINKVWNVYDAGSSQAANDFENLEKGKGYWAKIDDGAGASNALTGKTGLVLGSSATVAADYNDSLNSGWNLLAYSDVNPNIRSSSTGLVITVDNTASLANDIIKITDASGANTVDVILDAADTAFVIARRINVAIGAAKDAGTMPRTFDLHAFAGSNTSMTVISNKKFTIQDDAVSPTDIFTAVQSLTAGAVINTADSASLAATSDLPATGVTSVYGEYALVVTPLVGGTDLTNGITAAEIDVGASTASAAIQINSNTPIKTSELAGAADLASVITAVELDANIASATPIDVDGDAVAESLVLAATAKFSIRDHTFTRVLTFDNTNAATAAIQLNGLQTASVVPAGAADVDALAVQINAIADTATPATDTGIYAISDHANVPNTLIVFSASATQSSFDLIDDATAEFLEDTASSLPAAKGAISNVYTLDHLAKAAVTNNSWVITFAADADDGGAPTVDVNGVTVTLTNPTNPQAVLIAANDDPTRLAVFDQWVTDINAILNTAGAVISAVASHTYTAGAMSTGTIVVEGYGIDLVDGEVNNANTVDIAAAASTNTNAATYGELVSSAADVTSDLKYNVVYTPDYALDGPLYTLKGLGYTAEAMITSSTIFDASDVKWSSIDLTRPADEWFNNQDYNLFGIDALAGYWTYLTPNTDTNDINISNESVTNTYTHHFNNTANTAYNIVTGAISVDVDGLSTEDLKSAIVYASVDGTRVDLNKASLTNNYTGSLSYYELDGFPSNKALSVDLYVSDGTGYKLSGSTLGTIDFDAPAAPGITLNSTNNVDINNTSADVTAYYIFKNTIPDTGTELSSNKVKYVLAADANNTNLCKENLAQGSAYDLKLFAIDASDATITGGNASDITGFTYTSVLKGVDLLTNTEGVDLIATSKPMVYASDCVATQISSADSGIAVKSIVTNEEVKVAYAKVNNVAFTTDVPYSIFIGISGTSFAKLTYVPAYAGQKFFIQYQSVLYKGTFPADDSAAGSSTTPYDVDVSLAPDDAATINGAAQGIIINQSI